MQEKSIDTQEKSSTAIRRSLMIPVIFVILIWILELIQVNTGIRLLSLGIIPRHAEGLTGIITAPFIHSGFDHLLSNTLPILIVGAGLFYFYPTLAWNVILLIWSFTGLWVWISGRTSSHIGASGLIYGLVCFLFFSGILRKDRRLIAISLLVTFLYGSLVWGIFPVDQSVSWESHLFGALAGIMCALYYRKDGPQRPKAQWEIDEEQEIFEQENGIKNELESDPTLNEKDMNLPSPEIHIRYIYKADDDEKQADKGF